FRELERTSITTVEAYLRPKVSAYLGRLEREARARGSGLLRVMTSSGGTLPPGPAATRAAAPALAGPAGGVVAARLVGAAVRRRGGCAPCSGGGGGEGRSGAARAGRGGGAAAVMARARKRVSVARGLDPRQMALLPFGGAGPLFGCQLAEALGMRTIVIPPHPGALSALGLASAAERVDLLASFHRPLEDLSSPDLGSAFAPLLEEGRRMVSDGV